MTSAYSSGPSELIHLDENFLVGPGPVLYRATLEVIRPILPHAGLYQPYRFPRIHQAATKEILKQGFSRGGGALVAQD